MLMQEMNKQILTILKEEDNKFVLFFVKENDLHLFIDE